MLFIKARVILFIKAPMRKQGDIAASIPKIPGPDIEAARIIPRLAPGGLY
jgi:hypothetical protein